MTLWDDASMCKQVFQQYGLVWFVLLGCLLVSERSSAATAVAVDTDGGYASAVLAKVLNKWEPPALRGNYSVQIKVSLDGTGKVKNCVPVRPSSLEVFDQVACSAVYAAQPFGKTSYEAPLDVYLAFQLRENSPLSGNYGVSDADAMRAEVTARTRVERDLAANMADATEQRARERAMAAAKSQGKTLPEVHPAPVDPPKAKTSSQGKNSTQVLPSYGEDVGDKRRQQKTQTGPAKIESQMASAEPKTLDPAQRMALRRDKYTSLLSRSLTRIIRFPKKLPAGTYAVVMRVVVDAKGKILENAVIQSSGNAEADKAILQSVKVARTVPAPPAGLENSFLVPLTATK